MASATMLDGGRARGFGGRDRGLKMVALLEDVRVPVVTAAEIDALGDRDPLLANVNTSAECGGLEARRVHEL